MTSDRFQGIGTDTAGAPSPDAAGPSPGRPRDDDLASKLRGFGPIGIVAMIVILLTINVIVGPFIVLPIGALLVLAWARASHTPWREIGYVRPKSWILTLVGGVVLGSALKLVLKAIVVPLLGADPINRTYQFLAGNQALLPAAVIGMVVAGFGEETVIRGYMFERLGKLFGSSGVAKAAIVLITTAYFSLAHYDQGLAGIEQEVIVSLVFGTLFTATGRLFPLMCAHAAFDLTALALIYWDLESTVAHLVFH